jgi:hypothetical protein
MHPLTGSWKLIWNEARGVKYLMGNTPTSLAHISMNVLPRHPCVIKALNQHIDVENRVWIDSVDLFLPETESDATWTIYGRMNTVPDTDLPSMVDIAYEHGHLSAVHHPAALTEYKGIHLKLPGRGKAMVVFMNDVYRIDRDVHQRSAYLERVLQTKVKEYYFL